MEIISWIVVGLLVGLVAKLLMPGKDPGGWFITIILGIAGALVGGIIGGVLGIGGGWFTGFVLAVIGAMLLLWIYRLAKGRAAHV